MVTSTTPLAAFWRTVNYAYLEHAVDRRFLSPHTFNDIYFAFITLQAMTAPFTCPTCGPEPPLSSATPVFTSAQRTHTDLLPPSVPNGPSCTDIQAQRNQPFLPAIPLRRAVKAPVDDLKDTTSDFAATVETVVRLRTYTGLPLDTAIAQATAALISELPVLTAASPSLLLPRYLELLSQLSTNDHVLSII
ncbi:hypothetical protein JCM5296_007585 [Sporobolomyces johnsonii]